MKLHATRFVSTTSFSSPATAERFYHPHPPHDQLLLVQEGEYHAQIHGSLIVAGPGDAIILQDRVPKVSWTNTACPARLLVICFYWQQYPHAVPSLVHDEQGRLRLLGAWLQEVEAGDQELAGSYLQALLAEYLRLAESRVHPLIEDIRRRMAQHLAEQIDLARLASWVQLNRCYLARRYRQLSGATPMQDLQRLRLQRARELILTTVMPLKAVAAQVGLNDASHLSRLLRQHYGLTSKELRMRVI